MQSQSIYKQHSGTVLRRTAEDAATIEVLSKPNQGSYPLEQVVKSKFQDIQQAISYVPAEHENVYSNILMLSTRNSNNSDEIKDENIKIFV